MGQGKGFPCKYLQCLPGRGVCRSTLLAAFMLLYEGPKNHIDGVKLLKSLRECRDKPISVGHPCDTSVGWDFLAWDWIIND
jgi:hypothetical protein